MNLPSVSVVVVSWQRPDHLRRCLTALMQQDHPALELCLVLEPQAAEHVAPALRAAGWTGKLAENPGGNIAQARNIGLGLARGDVVAFIDDDAVAEPTWASRLARAFLDPGVVAATGHTRGRNGISLQWGGHEVDHLGADHPLPAPGAGGVFQGSLQRAVKPVGTNCAFLRRALLAVGGFDPSYHFYLEDADIGLRLTAHGATAVVPQAQVVHAFAASGRRRADRVPLDLRQIGASQMVFLRRHAAEADHPAALAVLRAEQTGRISRLRAARLIGRAQARHLAATLEAGILEGASRPLAGLPPLPEQGGEFLRLPGTGPRPGRVLAGRFWQLPALRRRAEQAAAAGEIVTVICLSPTMRAHRVAFQPGGYWLQTGGLFGRAERSGPRLRLATFRARILEETARIAGFRPTAPLG